MVVVVHLQRTWMPKATASAVSAARVLVLQPVRGSADTTTRVTRSRRDGRLGESERPTAGQAPHGEPFEAQLRRPSSPTCSATEASPGGVSGRRAVPRPADGDEPGYAASVRGGRRPSLRARAVAGRTGLQDQRARPPGRRTRRLDTAPSAAVRPQDRRAYFGTTTPRHRHHGGRARRRRSSGRRGRTRWRSRHRSRRRRCPAPAGGELVAVRRQQRAVGVDEGLLGGHRRACCAGRPAGRRSPAGSSSRGRCG